MTLINAAMALGTLAFAVPLVIHLLFRSRYRTLDWGAMFLLEGVVRANRRRMQWHQWILLLLRCAIPVLLALAMARPLVTGFRSLPGDAPLSLVLIVDDSRSVQAAQRTETLLATTTELLDSLGRGDEVLLLRTSRIDQTPAAMSPQEARRTLGEIRFETGPVDWSTVLARGVDAIDLASHPNRRLVFASDFQDLATAGSAIDEVKKRLGRMTPTPAIDWINVAAGEPPLANLVVESVGWEQPAVVRDHPVHLTARVQNDSDLPADNQLAHWIIDGETVATEPIDVPPRSGITLHHTYTSTAEGERSVTVAIEASDALPADNRRDAAMNVHRQIRVWLVDGSPSKEPLRGETDFLRFALSPFALGPSALGPSALGPSALGPSALGPSALGPSALGSSGNRRRDFVETKVLTASQAERELREAMSSSSSESSSKRRKSESPQRPDVIVLANVERPIDVSSFVRGGGGVVFFDGDRVNESAWADCEWLPAALGEWTTIVNGGPSSPGSPRPVSVKAAGGEGASADASLAPRFEAIQRTASPWSSLLAVGTSPLDDVDVHALRRLRPKWLLPGNEREEKAGDVFLQTTDGAAVVVGRSVGRGEVIQFAMACDAEGSTWPLRPSYLPMMQAMVLHVISAGQRDEVLPGQPLVLSRRSDTDEQGQAEWQVIDPEGKPHRLNWQASDDGLTAIFRDTFAPGIYRFQSLDLDSTGNQASGRVLVRTVVVPSSESNLQPIDSPQLDAAATRLGAIVHADAASLVDATQVDRHGREIWRWLMLAVLVVMVGELLWQRRIGMAPRELPAKPASVPAWGVTTR